MSPIHECPSIPGGINNRLPTEKLEKYISAAHITINKNHTPQQELVGTTIDHTFKTERDNATAATSVYFFPIDYSWREYSPQ